MDTQAQPMITYLKLGGILAAIALIFVIGFHFGGMGPKTKLEGFQAAQAENTAKAVLAERASAATELARVNTILKGYQDEILKPVDSTIAERVLYRACPAGSPVPSAGSHAGGTVSASPQPRGDPESQRLLQTVFDACTHDANQLTAIQQAWPK